MQSKYFDSISSIVNEVSYHRGGSYFSSMLQQLYRQINADYLFIGRFHHELNKIETVCFLNKGQIAENFSYDLADTPCDHALSEGTCVFPGQITELFPQDQLLIDMKIDGYIGTPLSTASGDPMGILVALYEQPITNDSLVKALFNFFAGNIATELLNEELQSNLEELVDKKTTELQAQIEKTEQALRISDQLFNLAPYALMQVNENGQVIRANERAETLFLYSNTELLNMNVDDFVPKDLRSSHVVKRQFFHSKPSLRKMADRGMELNAVDRNGNYIPVEISLAPITSNDGSGLTVIVAIHDMADHKRLEHSLVEERNRAEALAEQKEKFLTTMSHEIRTPMNGVIGMSELLAKEDLNNEQAAYVRTITNSGKTLLSVINDILDFTKVSKGKVQLENITFNYREWIDQLIVSYKTELNNGVNLCTETNEEVPFWLVADTARLSQIYSNLISNAVKFTHKGYICIRTSVIKQDGGSVKLRVEVADTGIGMPARSLTNIFEAFSQADASTTRQYGGTGLGLTICKELVELFGGEIGVASVEGEGSTFHFDLQLGVGTALIPAGIDHTVTDDFSKLCILVAEDNHTNRFVAESVLKKLGVTELTFANNGKEAADYACSRERQYDLILMDCEMPIMDGYDATKTIRQWELENRFPAVTICSLSAHAMEDFQQKAIESGMDYNMTKPLRLQQITNILQTVLNGKT